MEGTGMHKRHIFRYFIQDMRAIERSVCVFDWAIDSEQWKPLYSDKPLGPRRTVYAVHKMFFRGHSSHGKERPFDVSRLHVRSTLLLIIVSLYSYSLIYFPILSDHSPSSWCSCFIVTVHPLPLVIDLGCHLYLSARRHPQKHLIHFR